MRSMRTGMQYVGLSCALLWIGCAPQPAPAPPDTRAADEAEIRKTDAAWAKVAQAKQLDPWVAFYSDDAVVLPPNEKAATTKAEIRKGIEGLLALPGLSVNWQAVKVEVAKSGDLGYLYANYELTMNDAKGKPVTDRGKIVEVWKKQADGSWKCAVDTWNSDLPAAPPAK